jgi:hypothetical protein
MSSNGKKSVDFNKDVVTFEPTVRFDDTVYTDHDSPAIISNNENNTVDSSSTGRPYPQGSTRRKSGILKRRENTITTADAPPIILSDEGLKAGRVSPFINFPLFLSMAIRSFGVIFGDM